MFNKIWHTLFEVKCVKFLVSMSGFEHEYEVTTADGAVYKTTREDYISYSSYHHWCCPRQFTAQGMLEFGIESGFSVDGPDGCDFKVQPIKVRELTVKAVTCRETFYKYYLWFKPELPSIETKKCDVTGKPFNISVKAEYDYEPTSEELSLM